MMRVSLGVYRQGVRLRRIGAPFFPIRVERRNEFPNTRRSEARSAVTSSGSGEARHKASVESRELLRRASPKALGAGRDHLARRLLLGAPVPPGSGRLEISEEGRTFSSGDGELVARVDVHDVRTYGAVLRRGSVGLGSSYVAGWWDSDDLTSLVRVLTRRTAGLRARLDRAARQRVLSLVLDLVSSHSRSERSRDRRNIRAHYDVSNELFQLMLDPSMTYSCAIFESPEDSLQDAQLRKIDRICRKLSLGPSDHLVEIGTGWGALAIHAATKYGCTVTTTTVSEAQHSHVEHLIAERGLTDRVTVLGEDWRDLEGTYDKLVSVEMIEAVDWQHHDEFLQKCASLLKADGVACIQMIVIEDGSFERAKRHGDFIRELVFPGSCIPSLASISSALARSTDLSIVDLEDIGRHYAETLRRWAENLERRAPEVDRLGADVEFRRLFSLYLAYCEGSFLERHISDVQLLLAKSAWRDELKAWSFR